MVHVGAAVDREQIAELLRILLVGHHVLLEERSLLRVLHGLELRSSEVLAKVHARHHKVPRFSRIGTRLL